MDRPVIHRSGGIDDLRHLRLKALLDEIVRDGGPRLMTGLNGDHHTPTAGLDGGSLIPEGPWSW